MLRETVADRWIRHSTTGEYVPIVGKITDFIKNVALREPWRLCCTQVLVCCCRTRSCMHFRSRDPVPLAVILRLLLWRAGRV